MLTIRHNELPVLALLLNPPPDAALVLTGKLHQLPQRQRVFSARMKKIRNQWISFAVCVRIRIGSANLFPLPLSVLEHRQGLSLS